MGENLIFKMIFGTISDPNYNCNVVSDLECLLLGLGVFFVATSCELVRPLANCQEWLHQAICVTSRLTGELLCAKLRTSVYECKSAGIKKHP